MSVYLRPSDDPTSSQVIGCAIRVHRRLGPGLMEEIYERCLAYELQNSELNFQQQVCIPIKYGNITIEGKLRADVIVEDRIILELKSVERLTGLHEAQLLTYMKLAKLRTGLLLNFNVPLMKDGIKRLVL